MNKIQKWLVTLLVICLSMGVLAACGENATTGGNTTDAPTTSTTIPETPTNSTETTQPTDPQPTDPQPTDPQPTDPQPTDPQPTDPQPTDPQVTEPQEVCIYKFTVLYEDTGLPVEEIGVQLCQVEPYVCLFPQYTDANGVVEYELATGYQYGVYQIHIMSDDIPEGYTFDNEAYLTSADVHEYTLLLKKEAPAECEHVYVQDKCILCGADKTYTYTVITKYPDVIETVDGEDVVKPGAVIAGVSVLINDGSKMIAQGVTNEKGEFSFEAPKFVSSDELNSYNVVITDGEPDGYYTNSDNSFVVSSYICTVEFYEIVEQEDCTAFNPKKVTIGTTTRFTLTQKRENDCFEGESSIDHMFHSPEDDSLYYFVVKPSKQSDVGHYKITISGVPEGVNIYLGHFPSTSSMVSPVADIEAVGNSPVIEFNMEERYLKDSTGAWTYNNSWIFGVRVEGECSYPVEFDILVERERDIISGVDVVETKREIVAIVEGAKKADEITGDISRKTVTNINYAAASTIDLVLGEDGYYHIGSADGALLMFNIAKNNVLLNNEYSFLTVNAGSGTENLLVSYIIDEMHYEVYYYASMLKEYGQLCNDDGLYPVNEQLYKFLKDWTFQRASSMITSGLDKDHAFLLACAYYA